MNAPSVAAKPWLSVIVPTYCSERWLGETLGSVQAEAADGVELILVDSSPSAATRDIAQSFAKSLSLTIFERPDLPMWHQKTNFAAKIAAADHLCWLHHDDLWLRGRAKKAREWIEAAPHAPLHLAPTAIVDATGQQLGVWRCPLRSNASIHADEFVERLLVQNFISTPAPVFRKDAFLACGGLDETLWYTADWDVWLKLGGQGQVLYHDDVTTAFRVHGSSLTVTGSRDFGDQRRQMEIVLDRHLSRLTVDAEPVAKRARASITVNAALASASAGDPGLLWRAASELASLGPSGLMRYLRDSRLFERVAPRLRAKLRGAF